MEHCQNCKHDKKAHMPKECSCGCATFQSANAPIIFNSIMAGEEISEQIARLRRIRAAADKLQD
jgi:hypothetical protein